MKRPRADIAPFHALTPEAMRNRELGDPEAPRSYRSFKVKADVARDRLVRFTVTCGCGCGSSIELCDFRHVAAASPKKKRTRADAWTRGIVDLLEVNGVLGTPSDWWKLLEPLLFGTPADAVTRQRPRRRRFAAASIDRAHADFDGCVAAARGRPLVVVRGRRPVALLLNVEGLDLEQLELGCDVAIWRQLGESRRDKRPHYTHDQVRHLDLNEPVTGAKARKRHADRRRRKR